MANTLGWWIQHLFQPRPLRKVRKLSTYIHSFACSWLWPRDAIWPIEPNLKSFWDSRDFTDKCELRVWLFFTSGCEYRCHGRSHSSCVLSLRGKPRDLLMWSQWNNTRNWPLPGSRLPERNKLQSRLFVPQANCNPSGHRSDSPPHWTLTQCGGGNAIVRLYPFWGQKRTSRRVS